MADLASVSSIIAPLGLAETKLEWRQLTQQGGHARNEVSNVELGDENVKESPR